ncbi:putative Asparagine--tRNA ligase [Blattamonas nauphoetae]|uniref:asparagine--tRNA ligase n=1 Tax=Blattamonas nauphoetae TaxID=2049346 RepID=A0ABQ9WVW0_9EUKA|nr:putative Asparagine--tRNA ligase [Blattamonas nauphoetae]
MTEPTPSQEQQRKSYEELEPEYLAKLEAELTAYEADLEAKGQEKTKSGRKKKEKEIRARLLKEQKASKAADKAQATTKAEGFVKVTNPIPDAKRIDLAECPKNLGQPIKVEGWIKHVRRQGKNLIFIDIRRRMETLQCVITGQLAKTEEASQLTRECCVRLFGTLHEEKRAPGEVEMSVDFIEIVGPSPVDLEDKLNRDSNPEQRMNQRHLDLRSDDMGCLFSLRAKMMAGFRTFFQQRGFAEVTPPTIVKNSCEGGSKMFPVKYYEEEAFLTESSQLYLETMLATLDSVYCVLPSYRAEKSLTRRHLAEYTHMEVEMAFYDFEDLLKFLEDMLVFVTNYCATEAKVELAKLNPGFKPLTGSFRRMSYAEQIQWLKDYNKQHPEDPFINAETGKEYEYGDDVPEKPERCMVDTIGEPILLHSFPKELKAFYMKPSATNPRETESVDVLIPTVGEIVGASTRIDDYQELMDRYKELGMDTESYYWYNDLRKYGSCPHAGFGLGVERLLCWIGHRDHIRDACMFPRYMGRITP